MANNCTPACKGANDDVSLKMSSSWAVPPSSLCWIQSSLIKSGRSPPVQHWRPWLSAWLNAPPSGRWFCQGHHFGRHVAPSHDTTSYKVVYISIHQKNFILKAFFAWILIIFNWGMLAQHKEKPGNLQLFWNGGSTCSFSIVCLSNSYFGKIRTKIRVVSWSLSRNKTKQSQS
jgi:hypothetical protein